MIPTTDLWVTMLPPRSNMMRSFMARDPNAGFVTGVTTTRIYCRASCPAKKPRPENVQFVSDITSARAAGYRPCLRCKPDAPAPVRPASASEQRANRLLAAAKALAAGATPREAARIAGYRSTSGFYAAFTRHIGVPPARYASKAHP